MPVGFVVVVAVLASVYPLFVVVRPDVVIRVQVRSTARVTDRRQGIGRWFQWWLRIDPDLEPWDDIGARRRVRVLGLVELLVVWVIAPFVILVAD